MSSEIETTASGTAVEDQASEQLVVMRLADEDYGVEITHVREVIRMQNITEVPQAPPGVEGIINLRRRFGLAHSDASAETRIVVVDAVTEVVTVEVSAIEPVRDLAAGLLIGAPYERFRQGGSSGLRYPRRR
jgi:purine-binding chemotaxis protein CheW